MTLNQDRSNRDLNHVLAQAALRNPTISNYRQEVQLIDEHAFDHQDITNVSHNSRQMASTRHDHRLNQSIHQRGPNVNEHVEEYIRPQPDHQIAQHYHEVLSSRVNDVPPVNPPPNIAFADPAPFIHPGGINRNSSNFRIYERVPWWVLLIIFLISLATFGGIIAWMFHRRRAVSQLITVNPLERLKTTTIEKQTIRQNNTTTPLIQQKKVISVDQLGNIVEKISTKTVIGPQTVTKKVLQQPQVATIAVNSAKTSTSGEQKKTVIGATSEIKGLMCGSNSFSFNNKCYSCPNDQKWNGSNCVSTVKHLKKI